jgi:predicted transcriptional regulator
MGIQLEKRIERWLHFRVVCFFAMILTVFTGWWALLFTPLAFILLLAATIKQKNIEEALRMDIENCINKSDGVIEISALAKSFTVLPDTIKKHLKALKRKKAIFGELDKDQNFFSINNSNLVKLGVSLPGYEPNEHLRKKILGIIALYPTISLKDMAEKAEMSLKNFESIFYPMVADRKIKGIIDKGVFTSGMIDQAMINTGGGKSLKCPNCAGVISELPVKGKIVKCASCGEFIQF